MSDKSYSEPTYIAIRSGKYDTTTAYSHGRDAVEEFKDIVKVAGVFKHLEISDGGADENP